MMSMTSRRLMLITWIIEGIALLPPILSLLPDSHPAWIQNQVFMLIIAPAILFLILLLTLARFFFIPVAISVCAVILRSDISPRMKAAVTVVGILAFVALVHDADAFKHSW